MSIRYLEDMCLDKIYRNFDLYHLVFTTTKDESILQKLEFMQRKYSDYLLQRLEIHPGIAVNKMKVIDLFMNRHLQSLETSWLATIPWNKMISKMSEIGYNLAVIIIRDIYFSEFPERSPWDKVVCYLPNLKKFTFHGGCRNLTLRNVAKFCPDIEEIDIVKSAVTIEALVNLGNNEIRKCLCLQKLRKLYIKDTRIMGNGVNYLLKILPSLETIDHPKLPLVLYSLYQNDLSSLDQTAPCKLDTLDLKLFEQHPSFADIQKLCLSICPHLKSLTCVLSNVDELNLFSNITALEHLYIACFPDLNINLNALLKSKGKTITSLTIVNCVVSISVLAESCTRVEKLKLNNVHLLTEDGNAPLFKSLRSCIFKNFKDSTDVGPSSLLSSVLPKLDELTFKTSNLLSSDVKICILKCCELYPVRTFSITRSLIEKEYIKDLLSKCHTLKYLIIESCLDKDGKNEIRNFYSSLTHSPFLITSCNYGYPVL